MPYQKLQRIGQAIQITSWSEKHYLSLIAPLPEVQSPSLSATSSGEPPLAPSPQLEMTTEETTSYCHQALVPLQAGQQLEILSELFSLYLSENSRTRAVPHDFLELVVQGMRHLQEAGRSNVIYSLRLSVLCAQMTQIHFCQQRTCQWDSLSMQ